MSRKTLIIKQTGQIVTIEREWPWSNVVITLDGREIGHFNSLKDLKGGRILKTPIGDITVELKPGVGFEAWYDGEFLEARINNDPYRAWHTGYRLAIGLGVFNIIIGLIAMTSKNSFLTSFGAGPYSLVFGVVPVLLGVWSWRRHSAIALWIAAFIFGADGALGFILLLMAHTNPSISGLLIRAAFVFGMAGGAMNAQDLDLPPKGEVESESEFIYEKAKKRY